MAAARMDIHEHWCLVLHVLLNGSGKEGRCMKVTPPVEHILSAAALLGAHSREAQSARKGICECMKKRAHRKRMHQHAGKHACAAMYESCKGMEAAVMAAMHETCKGMEAAKA
eukprot:1139761-Pelagomonas_calceolata.AAC.3